MFLISAGSILVFPWTMYFFSFFLLKNRRFDSIFEQTYEGEYYQHPAVIGRPVMQSGILDVHQFRLIQQMHSLNHKQSQCYIFNIKSLIIMGNTISFIVYCTTAAVPD